MSFCGSREGSLSVRDGVIKNKCFVDVMNIIPHGFFLLVTSFILIAWRESVMGQLKAKTWVHFRCHAPRYIFTITLIIFSSIEIFEGVVSDYIDPDSVNFHVIVPPCFALISSIVSLVMYHNIEMWNSPRFLLIFFPYWISCCGLKLLKVFSLYVNNIEIDHLRLWICCALIANYAILFAIEMTVLCLQRYAFFKKRRKVHPPPGLENTRYYATYANFISRATFWWIGDILMDGFKSPLTHEQLGKLPKSEETLTNYKKMLQAFEKEKTRAEQQNKVPSFHRVYLRAFWPHLLFAGLFRIIGDLLAFVGPWSIESIVNYAYEITEARAQNETSAVAVAMTPTTYLPTNTSNVSLDGTPHDQSQVYYVTVWSFLSNGYGLCILLFVATLFQHTLLHNHHFFVIRQGIRIRSAIQAMVYTKALRLSSLSINSGKMTMGQIVNHMSMDSNFIMMSMFFIHYIWAIPLQVIICMVLLYYKLGVSALLGGLIIILSAPAQVFLGRAMSRIQKKVMACADTRVKQCNEMVQGIKVIKLLAWESFFIKAINKIRAREIRQLLVNTLYRSLYTFIGTALPVTATLLTFILYPYIEKEPLLAGKALSTLALFNVLIVPLVLFSYMASTLIMANVSAKRLMPFFLAPEVEGNHGVSDSIKTGAESVVGELDGEHPHIVLQPLLGKERQDSLHVSTCSLVSHHSHTPRHSRHNSSSSLFDCSNDLIHVNSASVLSPNADPFHSYNQRRRHQSGVSIDENHDGEPLNAVEVEQASFSWDLENKEPLLKQIDMKIPQGKLIMIVGPVGSGKTSLLSALLGEMLTVSGKVTWCRNASIAYVSQKPWLLNKTMRENILFGNNYSWKRYQKVIESCALQPDIDSLPAGDSTEIGEKGVNLSGGQKQRVCIARALYSPADIIIMDDPLSALDVHVGRHVFEEVILKKLMRRKKTVILVTHQLQYLNSAHSVMVMKEGEIEYQGKLTEVKKTHPDLYESWRKALKEAKTAESTCRKDSEKLHGDYIDNVPAPASAPRSPARQVSDHSTASSMEEQACSRETNGKIAVLGHSSSAPDARVELESGTDIREEDETVEEEEKTESSINEPSAAAGKLIKKEHRESGSVKFSIYLRYLASCGPGFVLVTAVFHVVNQALLVSTNVWIAHWSSKSTAFVQSLPSNSTEEFDNGQYIYVYVGLSVSAVIITQLSGFILYYTGVRGSKTMHRHLLHTILKVPMRFFDTNLTGRIINRFSSDIGQIDQKIPNLWDSFLRSALATLAAIIVNCIGTPYFLIVAFIAAVVYWGLQKFYVASSRELQRIDSVTKSPIFSHFSETLDGLQTIRAYKAQSRFRQIAVTAIDNNVIPALFVQTTNRWLGVRLDYMGSILVFASAVASLSAGLAGHIDPAYIGLSIAYALMVSNFLNWIVRNSTELEMMMNAVERVDEYTQLKTETTQQEESTKEIHWPSSGQIEFRNVSLCYDVKLEPVVNNITFRIQPGEKIGICGRTGSGKSTLTLALFRMIEITQGEVIIDGRNISHVPLPELRSKLAIIPQDPILFTGTVRYNLDPAGEIEDSKLWTALESVQLKDHIEALPQQLDANVSEGGENFSIGQKQLFCLARAFLRENKILMLDEATASIDLATDNKLQSVISTVFKDKTVITIAHRISTIMKYDRVMTMDFGQLKEFDSPKKLLENESSYFSQLVHHSYKE